MDIMAISSLPERLLGCSKGNIPHEVLKPLRRAIMEEILSGKILARIFSDSNSEY